MTALTNVLKRFTEFWWEDRGFSALLVVILVLFFLSPFMVSSLAKILLAIFFSVLLISGVAAISDRKFHRYGALLVAGNAFASNIIYWATPGRDMAAWWYLSIILFSFLLISVLLKRIFRRGPVTGHRIRGAIAGYVLIGISWAYIYQLVALFIDGAFSFPSSMTAQPGDPEHRAALVYYSFVTMATLGYGDIVPVHPAARMFAVVEALIGLLYPATLLARLVSLEIFYHNNNHAGQKMPDKPTRKRMHK